MTRYVDGMISRTPSRRLLVLSALAAIIGVAAGGAAWVLVRLIRLITNAALFHQLSFEERSMTELHVSWTIVLAAVIGAILISSLARWAPVIRGHGIPEAMEAVMTKQSRVSPRTALAKPISAAIAIGTGAPFGAEGPIIVTGGAIGSMLGQIIPVSPSERKILTASGAAAGMAATFGAPLAAVVLAIELLLFEFSARAFVPLVVAASIAGGMHSALFGDGPLFHVPSNGYAGLDALPAFAVLGLACGLLAIVISRGLFLVEGLYRRLPLKNFWHPAIGAVGFATIGLFVPRAGCRLRRDRRGPRQQACSPHRGCDRRRKTGGVVACSRIRDVGWHARPDSAGQFIVRPCHRLRPERGAARARCRARSIRVGRDGSNLRGRFAGDVHGDRVRV